MQTFEIHEIGTTIFTLWAHHEYLKTPCPDCHGSLTWKVTTAAAEFDIPCPRCGGKIDSYLTPQRTEWKVDIIEGRITGFEFSRKPSWNDKAVLVTSVSYSTDAKNSHNSINHDKAFTTREDAEAAAAALLEKKIAEEDASWRENRERDAARAGADIVRAIESKAAEGRRATDRKIDKLKEAMLKAIRWPTIDGPTLTTRSYGGSELTSEGLSTWLNGLLDEAGIEGFSEEALHEAMCQC